MPSEPDDAGGARPRLVLLTANDVARDLPARQFALAAAADGWDVVVVSRAPGSRRQRARLGPVSVVQVPVDNAVRRAETRRQQAKARGVLRLGFAGPGEREAWQAAFRARERQRAVLSGTRSRVARTGDRLWHRVRGSVAGSGSGSDDRVVGDWRRDLPLLLDLELALGPAVQRLQPDLVVADGIAALPTAAPLAARLGAQGRTVPWIYVARQHAGSTEWDTDATTAAFREVERTLAGTADRVAAVSTEVAAALGAQLGRDVAVVADPADLPALCRSASGLAPEPRTSVLATATLQPVVEESNGDAARDLPWRALGDTPVRLGLGMANFAGQLSAFAQAVTTASADVSAEVVTRTTDRSFGYPTDVTVTQAELATLAWQVTQLERVLPRYTHLLADSFLPVFGTLNGADVAADLPALAQAGVDVALLAHGSDIRDPRRHRDQVAGSLFRDAPPEVLEVLVRNAARHREIAETAGRPLFVTTPDLLADLPGAAWVPLVVDVEAWASDEPVLERPRPVVLHAPSQRWTKGTDRFLPALEALDAAGTIELHLAEGEPWETMRRRVQAADIVVDQVAIGSYGTFACEAMAAGRPVLAHLTDDVTDIIAARAGGPPPLVNVTADGVAEAITALLDDRDRARKLGEESADYARRVHDGRMSAAVLDRWLRPDEQPVD